MLVKEEGVGINCSKLRKAGQGSWCRLLQDPRGDSGQDTLAMHLPADSTSLTLISSLWLRRLSGLWGLEGALQASGWGGGREEGDK